MADNVTVINSSGNTGSDYTAAADEIAGLKHQRVKISVGDDGAAADCGPSNPLPVSGALSVTGTMDTDFNTGLTAFSNTALSNTKTAVKASAGKVYGWMVHNPSAATAFIQVWNVAIGSITVGTTAPTWTIPLPAGASANVMSARGVTHSTEINVAATTTATGSTAPATALVVTIFYI